MALQLPCSLQDGTQDFEDISHSDSARDWASKLPDCMLEAL